jgi:hypothetical protein
MIAAIHTFLQDLANNPHHIWICHNAGFEKATPDMGSPTASDGSIPALGLLVLQGADLLDGRRHLTDVCAAVDETAKLADFLL